MIASAEATIAVATLEGFSSGVLAIMAGEFIRSGESPFAALPRTLVGFFSCMRPLVRFEVGTLRVDLFTAQELTFVYPPLAVRRVVKSAVLRRHARRLTRDWTCRRSRHHRNIPGQPCRPNPYDRVPRHAVHPQSAHVQLTGTTRTAVTVSRAGLGTRGGRQCGGRVSVRHQT